MSPPATTNSGDEYITGIAWCAASATICSSGYSRKHHYRRAAPRFALELGSRRRRLFPGRLQAPPQVRLSSDSGSSLRRSEPARIARKKHRGHLHAACEWSTRVLAPPIAHGTDDRAEIAALCGEDVLGPRGTHRIEAPLDDTILLKRSQTVR